MNFVVFFTIDKLLSINNAPISRSPYINYIIHKRNSQWRPKNDPYSRSFFVTIFWLIKVELKRVRRLRRLLRELS